MRAAADLRFGAILGLIVLHWMRILCEMGSECNVGIGDDVFGADRV